MHLHCPHNARSPSGCAAVRSIAAILVLAAASGAADRAPAGTPRPNILIILADDLGFSDPGCYGGEIRTPNLDALAAGGLRFVQAYNSSRCCPSRASLLTGLYPHQAGIGRFVGNGQLPGYRGRLTERCVTLAEALGRAGYGTYACGKWHVNEPGPVARGFGEFYGFVHGYAVDSWEPGMMVRLPEGRPQRRHAKGEYYATDAITDHALDFLELARGTKRPGAVWELYDLRRDPAEQHDLAPLQPERVEQLSRLFLQEARRTQVLPAP